MPVDTLLSFIASERTQSWGFSQKPVGNKGLILFDVYPFSAGKNDFPNLRCIGRAINCSS